MTFRRCHASTFHEQMTKEPPKNFFGRFENPFSSKNQFAVPSLQPQRSWAGTESLLGRKRPGHSARSSSAREAALATAVLAMPDTMLAAQRLASQSRQSRQRLDVAGSLATFDESTTENCCACGELRITGEVSLCGDIECVVDIDWLRERDCARHRVTRFVHQRLPSLRPASATHSG